MASKKKVAIYGGTFSPPHVGHVNVAKAVEGEIKPDKLLIIPTFISPHKSQCSDALPKQRLEMCRLAFSDIGCAQVSDMEIVREGKSYTYDTICELYQDDVELILVCGTDMILSFDRWYRFQDILKMVSLAYVRRENDDEISRQIDSKVEEYRQKYNASVKELKVAAVEISSSEIREKIKNGSDVSSYLPANVKGYVEKWKIYCK